ncbi:MAG: aldo/keto reductase [Planctomycetota bacterium]
MEPTADSRSCFTVLGRTGREVHRLGVAASYGVGGRDLEAAVEEHGVNYLYWGSRRTGGFGDALRALSARGLRERLFVVVQSYSRLGCLVRPSLRRALRQLGTDHADLLLLGWWNKPVSGRILDAARACQREGLVRHLGVSTHQRPLVPGFAGADSPYDVVHLRYNAANRGAERDIFPHVAATPAERAGLVAFTATRWRELLRAPAGAPKDVRVPTAGDCYRFVLGAPQVDVCMSGPADGEQLRHAIAAVERGPFAPEEQAWIEGFGDLVYAAGSVRTSLERF